MIDGNSDTVKRTIPVGMAPTFILNENDVTYVVNINSISIINAADTVNKTIALPQLYSVLIPTPPTPPVAMYMNSSGLIVLPTPSQVAYDKSGIRHGGYLGYSNAPKFGYSVSTSSGIPLTPALTYGYLRESLLS